jgi:hypothetical protein
MANQNRFRAATIMSGQTPQNADKTFNNLGVLSRTVGGERVVTGEIITQSLFADGFSMLSGDIDGNLNIGGFLTGDMANFAKDVTAIDVVGERVTAVTLGATGSINCSASSDQIVLGPSENETIISAVSPSVSRTVVLRDPGAANVALQLGVKRMVAATSTTLTAADSGSVFTAAGTAKTIALPTTAAERIDGVTYDFMVSASPSGNIVIAGGATQSIVGTILAPGTIATGSPGATAIRSIGFAATNSIVGDWMRFTWSAAVSRWLVQGIVSSDNALVVVA